MTYAIVLVIEERPDDPEAWGSIHREVFRIEVDQVPDRAEAECLAARLAMGLAIAEEEDQ